ncbi:hypothetical protein ACU82A_11240 [Bacillus cereus]
MKFSKEGLLCQVQRIQKGPIVKTGPTAGQNRTRNKDGAWRAKRSDAGKPRPKQEKSN